MGYSAKQSHECDRWRNMVITPDRLRLTLQRIDETISKARGRRVTGLLMRAVELKDLVGNNEPVTTNTEQAGWNEI